MSTDPSTTARRMRRNDAPTAPSAPATLADTGLSGERIAELVLKTLYTQGTRSGRRLVEALRLPFRVVDEQLLGLQRRRLLEVREAPGPGRGGYHFGLTSAGRRRARDAMATSRYVGPAPVPLADYRRWMARQSIRNVRTAPERIREGFRGLVLDDAVLEALGPAVNSARSIFLYGEPGNGKTMIAETIARLLGGTIFLPHAVDVNGQTVVVYDPIHHRRADVAGDGRGGDDAAPDWLERPSEFDRRYTLVRRPVVMTGGELTLDQLDLQYDRHTKTYQAPFQMKANGGVLIVDDFGRQRVPPRELLNRWIVPLEKRVDFLTLHTGGKFPVPFACLLVFATNIDPDELVEEAFLRRIRYKIHVADPTAEQYREIFRRACADREIPYDADAVRHIYREFYEAGGIAPRGCHPRDLLEHVRDIARFRDTDPVLSPALIERAARTYFLVGARAGGGRPGR